MVRGAVRWPDAARAAEPGRLRASLPGPADRLSLPPHRPLSVQRPVARARARSRTGAGAELTESRPVARRVLVALGAAVLAGAWVFAAVRLWRTGVPGDLELPEVDPHRYFTDAQLDRAAS